MSHPFFLPRLRRRCVTTLLVLAALIVICPLANLAATPPVGTCFTVIEKSVPAGNTPRLECKGSPKGYQHRILALRLAPTPRLTEGNVALAVHLTRFEQMAVRFVYTDGTAETQAVREGRFGDHWHIGGQISFATHPGKRVAGGWLIISGLHSYDLLRFRLVAALELSRQFELGAVLVGAALALLVVVALYNLGLALVLRRQFFLWHGGWAACVLLWGTVWSQLILVIYPEWAGTASSKIATIFACLAVVFASLCATSAVRPLLPQRLDRTILLSALAVFALGVLTCLPGANLAALGVVLSVATLATLLTVAVAICWAWRLGDAQARDLAISWSVPMVVLGATQLFDFDTALFGGGAQIAVLFASAFQAICLSVLATFRLNALRSERDFAVAAGTRLTELADRDGLTGLLNRRGFVSRCEASFGELATTPFALLLIDVDQFKTVNDRYGHEAGDRVLVCLGAALRALEHSYLCLAGRLGGEEFVIGVSGVPETGVIDFANAVREVLRECDHGEISKHRPVTVSIGVATGAADGPFQLLYGRADRALYEAKRSGRDKVVLASDISEVSDKQLTLSLNTDQSDEASYHSDSNGDFDV